MDKRTPLLALLLLSSVPAAAEFCTFDGSRKEVVVLGPQVWRWNGSCDSLKSRFESKKQSLDGDPSHEDVFEALKAERISMGDLAERLVEGKKPKKD